MTEILIASDRFFAMPRESLLLAIAAVALAVAVVVWLASGRRLRVAALAAILVLGSVYGYYRVFRSVMGRLGRHLPTVTLLEPRAGDTLGPLVMLRAHATDAPGALGPIPAVRVVEYWLYHPSFREQQPENHESKVFLGEVPGPTADDQYATSWACVNPYTPARDGVVTGGAGTRTYVLPNDGRTYSIQAHALDDEWRATGGKPGFSERVVVGFEPCK